MNPHLQYKKETLHNIVLSTKNNPASTYFKYFTHLLNGKLKFMMFYKSKFHVSFSKNKAN